MVRRNTKQKDIILQAVRTLKTHLTAEEIYDYIHKDYPNISIGTVYRNLSVLAEEGKIKKIETFSGAVYFDFTTSNHFHLKCDKCGKLFDVLLENEPNLLNFIKDKGDLNISSYDIIFKGLCYACEEKESKNE